MKRSIIGLIRVYQKITRAQATPLIPFFFASGCRSWPTCSDFTIQALEQRGLVRGLWAGLIRCIQCNPLVIPKHS